MSMYCAAIGEFGRANSPCCSRSRAKGLATGYFPTEEHDSEEFKRFLGQHPEMAAVLEKGSSYEAGEQTTDYRVLDA